MHEGLTDQSFERILHFLAKLQSIFVNVRNHQACDILDIRLDLLDILDHKKNLQHIDIKAVLLVIRVEIFIVKGTDDNALVGMVDEFLQRRIEPIKGNQHADLPIHYAHCRFLKQCQHGALSVR